MTTVALLIMLVSGLGLILAWADRRYRPDSDTLIGAIDELLPQTQCAQCGYPGCRPYAEAVANGAAINLCPPGGTDTHEALARLLRREGLEPPQPSTPYKAMIDEQKCIGCYLCVQACPVDAIVGAPQLMHTVLETVCTGCELCLPPCPVDCIELIAIPAAATADPATQRRWPNQPATECIRCGFCEDACPVNLQPQELLWFNRGSDTPHPATTVGLERCIECGLCNQACPSNIDLVGYFQRGRRQLRERAGAKAEAASARARFQDHERRVAARRIGLNERRNERIAARAKRDWPT